MGVTVHNILAQTIPFIPGEFPSASPLTGCNPLTVPFYFSSYWCDPLRRSRVFIHVTCVFPLRIAMILFQSTSVDNFVTSIDGTEWRLGILFIMMMINMCRGCSARRGLEGTIQTPILTVFFRDGTVFYAMYAHKFLPWFKLPILNFNHHIGSSVGCSHWAPSHTCCLFSSLQSRTPSKSYPFQSIRHSSFPICYLVSVDVLILI